MLARIEGAGIRYSPLGDPRKIALGIAADGAVKGRRATVLDYACLFISHDVLDVGAGVVFATTLYGEVVGQLTKRVWSRDSIDVIIEEIKSLL